MVQQQHTQRPWPPPSRGRFQPTVPRAEHQPPGRDAPGSHRSSTPNDRNGASPADGPHLGARATRRISLHRRQQGKVAVVELDPFRRPPLWVAASSRACHVGIRRPRLQIGESGQSRRRKPKLLPLRFLDLDTRRWEPRPLTAHQAGRPRRIALRRCPAPVPARSS